MPEATIPYHSVVSFGRNLMHVPQTRRAKLIDCVDSDINFSEPGEYFTDEQLGSSNPQLITDRFGDTPSKHIDRERRGGYYYAYEDSNDFDNIDKLLQLVDPANTTIEAMQFGVARSRDDFIMAGLLGAVRQGKTLENSVAFPAGQQNTTAGELTLARIQAVGELLDESEVDEDGVKERFWVGSPIDKKNLLGLTPVQSADYNTIKALVNGEIDTFYGFTFIWLPTARMLKTAGGRRRCIAWTKKAGVYRGRPIVGGENAKLMQRPDKKGNYTAYLSFQQAFMRRFDGGVVEVLTG